MKGVWIAIVVLLVAVGGFFVFVQQAKKSTQQSAQALEQGFTTINRPIQDDNRRLELKNIGTEIDIVRLQYGDVTAKLYEKCRLDPPKTAANQAKCEKLILQVNQRWAKDKAAKEVAAKKW